MLCDKPCLIESTHTEAFRGKWNGDDKWRRKPVEYLLLAEFFQKSIRKDVPAHPSNRGPSFVFELVDRFPRDGVFEVPRRNDSVGSFIGGGDLSCTRYAQCNFLLAARQAR